MSPFWSFCFRFRWSDAASEKALPECPEVLEILWECLARLVATSRDLSELVFKNCQNDWFQGFPDARFEVFKKCRDHDSEDFPDARFEKS